MEPLHCTNCSASLDVGQGMCHACGARNDALLGRFLLGQYRLIRKLGQGGFGAVYEAYQPSLERKVAIKVLHNELTRDQTVLRRFRREGLIASKIEHPCAVKVFNLGETEDGYLWLAMEYVQGETLEQRLRTQGVLSPATLVDVLGPVCEVLAEAHQKGIVHRDLKPDNVMITTLQDGKILPKVLDFGIASLQGAEPLTHSSNISGTPHYMAPEQWEGLYKADARADLYALGVILYRCLSGRFPFEADTPLSWMKKHHFEEPLDLQIAMKERALPLALRDVVMRALAKDPTLRPQSALAFKDALEDALYSTPSRPALPKEAQSPPMRVQIKVESTRDSLLSIVKKPSGEMIAVGEHGVILMSDPSGTSWTLQESASEAGLFAVALSSSKIFVCGNQGTLLSSTDGRDWTTHPLKTKAALRSFWVAPDDTIFVAGDYGTILRSTDEGQSWLSLPTGVKESFGAVWGVASGDGLWWVYAVGHRGMIVCSRDEGKTWQRQASGVTETLYWIHGSSPHEIYAVGAKGVILRALDGERWQVQESHTRADLRCVRVQRANEAYATSIRGELLRTSDGGETWHPQKITEGTLLFGLYSDSLDLWVVGQYNFILRSLDRGETFSLASSGTFPHLMAAYGDLRGLCFGGNSGLLAFLAEGSSQLEAYPTADFPSINSLWRSPSGEIYAAGLRGYLFLLDQKKQGWTSQGVQRDIYTVWGSGPEDIYLVGADGLMMHSSDRGSTWQARDSGVSIPLVNMWGSGPEDIYVIGLGGLILHSTDQGYTWERQDSDTFENLQSIWGSGPFDVYIVGASGTILHSQNRGHTWLKRQSNTRVELCGVWGSSPHDILIAGDKGTLLHSSDQGWTWQSWPTETKFRLVHAWRAPSGDVLVVGYNGTFLRYHQSPPPLRLEASSDARTFDSSDETLPSTR